MFPESAYANRSLDGLPIKIIKSKNECPEAAKLANWLLGAFEALEKKYLREIILIMYKDRENPDIVDEMYTFKFSYPDGEATCQLLQGGKEAKKITDADVKKSTQSLLRTLVILTQDMNPIGDSIMSMKLTYYDEVTPKDYEPSGFRPTPLIQPQLPASSVVLQSGEVATNHHNVQLGVQAVIGKEKARGQGQLLQREVNTRPKQSGSLSPELSNMQPNQDPSHSVNSHLGQSQSQVSLAPSSVSLLSTDSSHVQCICMNVKIDPIMLDCHLCSYQQHAACYRIIDPENIPTEHCCATCSEKYAVPCTDSKLLKMSSSNPTAVASTCLFRRMLSLLLVVQVINVEIVMEMLGITYDMAEAVIKKVGDLGCLEDDEVEGQWKVVKYVLEGKVVPKFMGRKGKKGKNKAADKSPLVDKSNGDCDKEGNMSNGKGELIHCSVAVDAHQVSERGDKRSPPQGKTDDDASNSKKKKVSEVKKNLHI